MDVLFCCTAQTPFKCQRRLPAAPGLPLETERLFRDPLLGSSIHRFPAVHSRKEQIFLVFLFPELLDPSPKHTLLVRQFLCFFVTFATSLSSVFLLLVCCLHQVNNGVHFVEEEPILLCNMVRLLATENQLSEFSLLFRHTSCCAIKSPVVGVFVLPSYYLRPYYLSSTVFFVIVSATYKLASKYR